MWAWALLRRIAGYFFDRYRPELHYMRGPGPKWLEAHGQVPARVRGQAR